MNVRTMCLRLSLLLAALAILGGCERFMSAGDLVKRAQSQFDAGNYGAAMGDAKTALDEEPGNANAHLIVARSSLRLGNVEDAAASLERARGAGGDAAAISELHYRILVRQRRYEDVLKELPTDRSTTPLRRLVLTAEARNALGQDKEAGEAIDQALALAPNDVDALLARAGWLVNAGRIDDAKRVTDELLQSHPDSAAAAALRARLVMSSGDAKGAVTLFGRARSTALKQLDVPEQLAILAGLIDAQLAAGDVAGAETNMGALQGRVPDAFITYYLRARIALLKNDRSGATDLLRAAVNRDPQNVQARLMLADVLYEQGALEQADADLSMLLAEHPENLEVRELLAKVYMKRGDLAAARRLLDEGPASAAGDWRLDRLGGSLRLLTGETEEGLALLEKNAAANPGKPSLQLDLAQGYLMAGRLEQAQKVLHALPPASRGERGAQLLVLSDVWGKGSVEARAAITRIVAESPKDPAILMAGAMYLLQANSPADASDLFNRVLAIDARNSQARLGLVAAAMQKGDVPAAEGELRKIVVTDAANERAYLGLASLALNRGDRRGARAQLELAIGANPSAVESRLRLAEMAFLDQDAARGNGLLAQALTVSTTRALTLQQAGRVLMSASRYADAYDKFKESEALGQKQAGLDAAEALLKLGRTREAQDKIEDIARSQPTAPAPAALLVQVDLSQKRFDAALARIAAFEKAGGAAPIATGLRAQTLEAAGRNAEALQAYESLQRLRPSGAAAVKLYTLRSAAKAPAPESVLVDWVNSHPQDANARLVLAGHYQQQGDRGKAIAQYEALSQVSKRPEVLNNLAWLYFEAGDGRALDMARAAYDVEPARPEIGDTYGWILLARGQVAQALTILETAARAQPATPDLQYHYAAALARSGKTKEAASVLRKLLAQSNPFPSRGDAQKLLDSLG